MFVGGADNHRLAAGVREVLDHSPYEGTLVGLYTRLVEGYDSYPKLSKSIPASRFTLDAPSERIHERVMHPGEEYDRPADSLVFQMMCLASLYSVEAIDSLRAACAAGDEAWKRAKREYAEWLIEVANVWKATG